MDYASRKIQLPEEYESTEPVIVGKHHIDTNHHVNNAQYVEIAREVLPDEVEVSELRVEYKKAAVFGDVIYPRVSRTEEGYTASLCDERGAAYAVIWLREQQRGCNMIELGKMQTLVVQRVKEFGVYVGEEAESQVSVLLPKKQVPEGTGPGDRISVFIYKDSEDRLIATTAAPKLLVDETAVLQVKEVGKIGAFLDMGLEKDLLLPFKEQTHKVRAGEKVLVALYIDKSKRLAATMRVYSYMSNQSPYKKDDQVTELFMNSMRPWELLWQ